MANKKISELPYINVSKISGNTLVPLVTYFSATTGDTVHTYVDDFQTYLISGLTGQTDVFVTGGTYSAGTITITNNTGGTFSITGVTFSGGSGVIGDYLPLSGGTVTGDTIFNQGLSASTISATTYLNLPITTDVFVTGGTYSNGDATFTNNTGGTFNVTGFYTGSTDIFVSGGTYSAGTITFTNTSGGTFDVTGLTTGSTSIVSGDYLPLSGGTVTGKTDFQSGVTINILTATTIVNTYLDSFYIRDNGGTLSIDNTTRRLLKSDGSTTSFDWENGILTGQTNIESSTISATTYQNLPSFSGGSGNCITDLYVTNVYGCSPITLQSSLQNNQTTSTGDLSHSEGFGTETAIYTAYSAQSVSSGLITLSSTYGDVTGEFSAGNLLLFYDIPFDNIYGSTITTISASTFNGVETEIQLQDINITTTTAYVGDISFGINNWTGDQTIPGHYSHAEGYITFSMGRFSHSEGSETYAIGENSHAEGYRSVSIGVGSHAEGSTTQSIGAYSHSEGTTTQSIGYASHSEGNSTISIGNTSHSEGRSTSSIGDYSHSEGISTKSGYKGYQTSTPITSGVFEIDTSYGDLTSIFITGSFIIFQDNSGEINTGVYTTYLYEVASSTYNGTPATEITLVDTSINTSTPGSPVGIYNSFGPLLADQSMGAYSHSEGTVTQAIGEFSHSEGEETVSLGWGQTVVGRFNDPISTPSAFIVGDGIDGNNRHNLLVAVNSGVTISGTLSATTYLNLPTSNVTGDYLPLSGGTVTGNTVFTSGLTANTLNVTGLTQTKGITSTGGITFKQVTINSTYSATTEDYMIDASGGTFSVYLPSAIGLQGRLINIKNNGGGAVTIQPILNQTIDDKLFIILGETNALQLVSNGSNWVALGYNISTVNTSTGVFEFTGITTASTTTFTVAPVKGWIVDNTTNPLSPQLYYVSFTGGTYSSTYVTTDTETYVYLTSGGTVSQSNIQLTEQQRRQNIFLGKLSHPNKISITNVFNQPDYTLSPLSQLRDMFTPIKLINGGIRTSANGVNLSFNTSAGYLYGLGINFINDTLNPDSLYVSGTSPCTFQYRTQTGGTTSNVTLIDPTKYDVGGVVTVLPGIKATNQRIYLLQNGEFRVQYGQVSYNTLALAAAGLANEQFVEFSNLTSTGILIGILSVLSTATDLSDSTKALFFNVSKFGDSSGAAGGTPTTNLQQAYNNSINPEIITNSTLDGLQIRGGTGNDNDKNFIIENNSGVQTAWISASGDSYFNTVTATTISATTYQNLPLGIYGTGLTFNTGNYDLTLDGQNGTLDTISLSILASDLTVTGGTYDPNTGVATFTNNTGGTFNVTGFLTGMTDTFVTGGTYSAGTITFTNTSGGTFDVTGLTTGSTSTVSGDYLPLSGGTVTGNTIFTQGLTANTISATTYQNLPTDIRITGATYSNNTFTHTNNTGGTYNVLFNTVTGLTVNGNLTVTGNTNVRAFTGTTGYISGSGQNILTVIGSGNSTTSPLFTVQGSSGELFSVTDSLTGSLFSVNDISGLPIMEVFSDNTTLWGSYQAPSLNTTVKTSAGTGSTTVYTLPQSAYTGAFFEYTVSSTSGARAGSIMSIFSGSSVQYTETTTNDIGTTTGLTFSVSANSTNAVLLVSGVTAGWIIKTIVRSI